MSPIIHVENLRKYYDVPVRDAGFVQAVKSLVNRQYNTVKAVDGVSFSIEPGEVIGFLGPNGAGKTTTLKMLSGLLHPTSGSCTVLGYTPFERDYAYLRQMTLVMGQRNNLLWDLPAGDTFELARTIYGVADSDYQRNKDALIELLGLAPLMTKPVRNLSLGERMKTEFALSLMHKPQVLFLDEPTIGLDITAQKHIRQFIGEYNQRYGATVLLTSHYMADVEALCKRVVMINHGVVVFDGALADLVQRYAPTRTITVQTTASAAEMALHGELVHGDDGTYTIKVAKADVPRVTAAILAAHEVNDIGINEPPIEDVIAQVYGR
jgi:ABC-2 type transport system ATP-binding protein